METSGTTGRPVKTLATDFTRLVNDMLALREHAWHQRDFSQTLVSILWTRRGFAEAPIGHPQATWGPPINQYRETGPAVFINIASETSKQIEALLHYQPYYVMSYPSQLVALAEYCLDHHIEIPSIKEFRTTGESFSDSAIHLIKKTWPSVKITDVYSSIEIGNIAMQCLEHRHYHVNAENTYFEIVDKNNQPCDVGEPGKILITSLTNYATPLIRYEIGDYAEWGEPCACGRGLPVLKKIYGRTRHRLIFPNGESRFPYLGERADRKKITDAIQKFQIVQHTTQEVEVKLITPSRLSSEQENALIQLYQKNLGFPFQITISYHEQIPAGPTGKYEEFISMVKST